MNPIRHSAPISVFALLAVAVAGIISRQALSDFLHRPALADQTSPSAVRSNGQSKAPDATAKARISQNYGKLPIRFESNRDQTDPIVKFIARGGGYTLFLTDDEAVLRIGAVSGSERVSINKPPLDAPRATARGADTAPAILRMRLVGANRKPRVSGDEQLQTTSNYFVGSDPDKWRT